MHRPLTARPAVAWRREDEAWMQRALATLMLLSALAAGLALAGCNTMEGAGQDVSAAGKAVTNSAEKTKQQL